MRKLKFRSWVIDDFRYLDLEEDLENEFAIFPTENIEQFTGLYDMNGQEIYEGDLLKWKHTYIPTNQTVEYIDRVYWSEKDAMYVVGDWYEMLGHLLFEDEVEVIGNIHEN